MGHFPILGACNLRGHKSFFGLKKLFFLLFSECLIIDKCSLEVIFNHLSLINFLRA